MYILMSSMYHDTKLRNSKIARKGRLEHTAHLTGEGGGGGGGYNVYSAASLFELPDI